MASKFFKGGKFAYEMLVPTVKKNLTKRRKDFEDLVTGVGKHKKGLTQEGKIAVSETIQPAAKKISKLNDKIDKIQKGGGKRKFNKGGRVGLKRGTFPDLNKDGKTTFADVLIGRGVLPKGKKKKMMAKKSKSPMDKAVRKA